MRSDRNRDDVHLGQPLKSESASLKTEDALKIEAVDHLEILSGNARQATVYYTSSFGFTPVAYRGPETGYREAASYVLRQGKVTLVITTPLRANDWRADFVAAHGDSVRGVAFRVPSCEAFYHEVMKRGAQSAEVPTKWEDDQGVVKRAAIHTYGETVHPIVERKDYSGHYWPGFVPYTELFPELLPGGNVGFLEVDHVVGNVELGKMAEWASFYERILGFTQMAHFTDEDISTEYSALMSKVLTDGRKIKFPINEPADGKKKSQIEEYLDFHRGPGVQHIAFLSGNIIKTVTELRKRGIPCLYVPDTYYEELPKRVGAIDEDVKAIRKLGILVDRDEDGYLLQLFTKPVEDRPTLFFEIIQRHGSQGFGIGNFKALFESIEREQALRGNL